jgi:hypothetical protein
MSHVQKTRYIRRRNYNTVGFLIRFQVRLKKAFLFPVVVPFFFNISGFITLRKCRFVHDILHYPNTELLKEKGAALKNNPLMEHKD